MERRRLFWRRPALTASTKDDQALALYERERRFLDLPQGRVAYLDRGRGAPTLLLHGFPLSSFQWRGVIAALAPTRRCLAPDFLGLGRTEVTKDQGVTPRDQAKMLIAFLDRLTLARVHVIANDSGGAVAQLLLAHHSERVETLLLTNCDTEIDSPPPAMAPVLALARDGTYPDKWLVPWLKDKALARSPQGLGGLCYSNPAHPSDAAIEAYLGPLVESAERKALTNRYALGLSPNPLAGISTQLKSVQTPVAVIWGMRDTLFSKQSPHYLAGLFKQFRGLRSLADAKLFFPEEYPDIVAQEALRLANG